LLRSRIPLLAVLLFVVALAGCASPTGPEADADALASSELSSELPEGGPGDGELDTGWGRWGRFYPLQPGNSWHYDKRFKTQIFPTGEPPLPPVVTRSTVVRRQLCRETIGDRSYLAEEATETRNGSTFSSWIYLREDRSGLYEADLDIGTEPTCDDPGATALGSRASIQPLPALAADPELSRQLAELPAAYRPAVAQLEKKRAVLAEILRQHGGSTTAAAGGERAQAEGELTRLSYPLHTGASWHIREDPLFAARVVGMDALPLDCGRVPAWRIRYTSELFGPNDLVRVWYSRWGYLGLEAHLEGDAVDAEGNVIGRVVDKLSERADEINLVGRRFASR
jgi:hypothetical protein